MLLQRHTFCIVRCRHSEVKDRQELPAHASKTPHIMESMTAALESDIHPRVARDLEKLQQVVVRNVPDVESLILTGSFAHDEGAFLKTASEPIPYNDYDVVVVAKVEPDAKALKAMGAHLAGEIGIRGVDLIGIGLHRFAWLPPSMFNFDLRHEGCVFHGNSNLLATLPDWDPGDIPLIEAQVVLLNRMMCLLECVEDGPKDSDSDGEGMLFQVNQTAKAAFALADAVALLHGSYAIRYEAKRNLLRTLVPDGSAKAQLVESAWRLRQELQVEDLGCAPAEFWQQTRSELLRTFQYLMNWMYANHRHFTSPQELGRFLASFDASRGSRRAAIEAAQYVTLAAWTQAGPDSDLLALARHLLTKVGIDVAADEWPLIRRAVVSAWFRYCH